MVRTPARRAASAERVRSAAGAALMRGTVLAYVSVFVLLPLAAVIVRSTQEGADAFWTAVTAPQALAALRLTLAVSLVVVAINALFGTLIAWVLIRDRFRGRRLVDSLIDLPFALPTIVAGLTLLALYGPKGPFGFSVAFTQVGIVLALAFVTLPFVVRSVQPVLIELNREMEEAAASLGARNATVFRRIILPSLLPAILAGMGLALARALGEFGAVVLISGNLPFKTEVAPVFIFSQIESDNVTGAAAVAVVLLAMSFVLLLGVAAAGRWGQRHER